MCSTYVYANPDGTKHLEVWESWEPLEPSDTVPDGCTPCMFAACTVDGEMGILANKDLMTGHARFGDRRGEGRKGTRMYLAMALYGFAILIPAVIFAVAILLVKIWQKLKWLFTNDKPID